MPRYVALLRAINVGGSHVVKMPDLRRMFEEMGFGGVETYIQSGNVIFDSSARKPATLERKIETFLYQALGYEVATFLRSISEMAEIACHRPVPQAELDGGARLFVAFLRDAPADAARRTLTAFRNETDEFHFGERELFWLCRPNFLGSSVAAGFIEKTVAGPATVRNVNTVKKIVAKYS